MADTIIDVLVNRATARDEFARDRSPATGVIDSLIEKVAQLYDFPQVPMVGGAYGRMLMRRGIVPIINTGVLPDVGNYQERLMRVQHQLREEAANAAFERERERAAMQYAMMRYGGMPYGSMPYGSMPYGSMPYGNMLYGSMPYGNMPGANPFVTTPGASVAPGAGMLGSDPRTGGRGPHRVDRLQRELQEAEAELRELQQQARTGVRGGITLKQIYDKINEVRRLALQTSVKGGVNTTYRLPSLVPGQEGQLLTFGRSPAYGYAPSGEWAQSPEWTTFKDAYDDLHELYKKYQEQQEQFAGASDDPNSPIARARARVEQLNEQLRQARDERRREELTNAEELLEWQRRRNAIAESMAHEQMLNERQWRQHLMQYLQPRGNRNPPAGAQPPGAGVPPAGAQPPGAGVPPAGAQPPGAGVPPAGAQPPGAGVPPAGAQPPGAGVPPADAKPPADRAAASSHAAPTIIDQLAVAAATGLRKQAIWTVAVPLASTLGGAAIGGMTGPEGYREDAAERGAIIGGAAGLGAVSGNILGKTVGNVGGAVRVTPSKLMSRWTSKPYTGLPVSTHGRIIGGLSSILGALAAASVVRSMMPRAPWKKGPDTPGVIESWLGLNDPPPPPAPVLDNPFGNIVASDPYVKQSAFFIEPVSQLMDRHNGTSLVSKKRKSVVRVRVTDDNNDNNNDDDKELTLDELDEHMRALHLKHPTKKAGLDDIADVLFGLSRVRTPMVPGGTMTGPRPRRKLDITGAIQKQQVRNVTGPKMPGAVAAAEAAVPAAARNEIMSSRFMTPEYLAQQAALNNLLPKIGSACSPLVSGLAVAAASTEKKAFRDGVPDRLKNWSDGYQQQRPGMQAAPGPAPLTARLQNQRMTVVLAANDPGPGMSGRRRTRLVPSRSRPVYRTRR